MTDGSVKDILAKFNQGNGPQIGVGPRPRVGTKPSVLAKPSAIGKDSAASNGIKSPSAAQLGKPGPKPWGPQPPQLNINEIATVKLKKSPVPRIPNEKPSTETPAFVNKPFPKPKPKPGVLPRGDSSTALTSSSSSPVPQSPSFTTTPSKPPKPHSALHPSPSSESVPNTDRTPPVPSPKDKKPRPPPPSRKDSLHKDEQVSTSPSPSPKPSFLNSQRLSGEDSRNSHWRNGVGAEDPPPPVSDSENSSASSIPDMPPRRTSFLHTNKVLHSKPSLQPLPPLMAIGPAPRKPAKPPNVSLARFTSSKSSAPHRPPKPGLQSPPPPSLPARPSIPIGVGGAKPRPSPPVPVAEEAEDSGEIYDDVEGNPPPPPLPVTRRRPISLIRPMDSDEEDAGEEGGFDEIYDDAESSQAPPPLPPSVPHHHPKVVVTGSGDAAAPPLPSISSIPAYHGSGGSNVSFPRSAEHSGSGLEDTGEIYDDVTNEAEGDFDELYEALDVSEDRNFQSSSTEVDAASEQEMRKQEERRKKEEERLRKEQEKQQRQEEERRKKKEREEKKKKEKEEKDIKKKFKIKGDISIIDEGIVMETMEAIYEKHDLKCSRGERIEILRKEGNPPGKWLARNPDGHYGYVDQQFVRVEGGGGGDADSGEVYDDVIGGEDEELEEDNIYDAVN
ncbi:uncharacterized protein [Diadema antillarum]|uniref:uncharacterized protein n=1 Tax=Diadema antillarum TaxID=105358 RepID=UPI003A87576C